MKPKRSGEAVRGAVFTGGSVAVSLAFLLGPWVTRWLDLKAARYGVSLPAGYHEAAVTAFASAVLYGAAAAKFWLVTLEDGVLAWLGSFFASKQGPYARPPLNSVTDAE